jgi:hypothetical protein
MRVVDLRHGISKIDTDYLRETGTMIYTNKNHRVGSKVINIVRTIIQRPGEVR